MNRIENDNQLEITKRWIADFKKSLQFQKDKKGSTEKLLYQLQYDATKSMIADLETQIKVYEYFKMGVPRRCAIELMLSSEIAVSKAVDEVEKLPPSEKLTEAIILLGKAKDLVSDWLEQNGYC